MKCSRCGSTELFYKKSCRRCYERSISPETRKYHREHAAAVRATRVRRPRTASEKLVKIGGELRRKYGITLAQRDEMLRAQGNCCAICFRKSPGKLGWATDHDHSTNSVRGILCHPCNRGIGMLGDCAERLRSASEYLLNGGHIVALRVINGGKK